MPLGRFPGTGPTRLAPDFGVPAFTQALSLPGSIPNTGSLLAGLLDLGLMDQNLVEDFVNNPNSPVTLSSLSALANIRAQQGFPQLGALLPSLTPAPTLPGAVPSLSAQFVSSRLNGQVPQVPADSLSPAAGNLASPSGDIPFAMTSPWRLTEKRHHHHHDHHDHHHHHDGGY